MTRSAAILAALQKEIAEHRESIDIATDISEITVSIRLLTGTTWVQGTQYTEERIVKARRGLRPPG